MEYRNTLNAVFLKRINRFTASVQIEQGIETVHVKTTGRCGELFIPGAAVMLQDALSSTRKTRYDLISVLKPGLGYVNVDSQIANTVTEEWLLLNWKGQIQRGKTHGSSRFDFALEQNGQTVWMEVKSVNLEINGKGYFPDAPTVRGVKHLRELSELARKGSRCIVCFVIAMNDIPVIHPNTKTDPAFAQALTDAMKDGVEIWHAQCETGPFRIKIQTIRQMKKMNLTGLK